MAYLEAVELLAHHLNQSYIGWHVISEEEEVALRYRSHTWQRQKSKVASMEEADACDEITYFEYDQILGLKNAPNRFLDPLHYCSQEGN